MKIWAKVYIFMNNYFVLYLFLFTFDLRVTNIAIDLYFKIKSLKVKIGSVLVKQNIYVFDVFFFWGVDKY